MLLVLCGYSAVGKDTYQNDLLERNRDLKRALSATTRPIRPGERNHREYIFVDENWYMMKRDMILSERSYKTIQDGKPATWYYGLLKQDFANENWITILDHEGANRVRNLVGYNNVKIVYLTTDDEELYRRSQDRKDETAEFRRRLEDDKLQFKGIETIADLKVISSGPRSRHQMNLDKIEQLLTRTF